MKQKNDRLEALRLIISSKQMGNQEELLAALREEGFFVTQATLSRDLKQLKVAKAATMNGSYIYVLPNETMYHRVTSPATIKDMMLNVGFISIHFSGNICVIKTRPGYASSLACNIDLANLPEVLGTVAGYDSILIVMKEGTHPDNLKAALNSVVKLD